MSRGTNNYSPSSLRFGSGLDYGAAYNPNSNESNYVRPMYSASHSFRPASVCTLFLSFSPSEI